MRAGCCSTSNRPFPGGDNTADAEAELLHLCLGNAEQAERLIALEMKKRPGLERREAARRAVHGLRRDV